MSDDLLSQMTPVILEETRAVGHDIEPRAASHDADTRRDAEPRRNAFGVPVDDSPELMRGAPVGTVTDSVHAPGESASKHEVMLVGGTPAMRAAIVEVLKTIYDPEIPVNIYELGLVYNIVIDEAGSALIRMTLTSPACPVAGSLPPEVEQKVATVAGVTSAKAEVVWEPPWTPDKMSDEAKLQLNLPY
jgi:FeS assembly SUF system protein